MERAKMKAAEILSDALIYQGEQGVKFSFFIGVSEAETPIELLLEDAD